MERQRASAGRWLLWSVVVLSCDDYDPPVRKLDGLYAACCGGRSSCVPEGLVAEALRGQLGQDSCGAALLCAPNEALQMDRRPFAVCKTESLRAEGRCLPSCLPAVQEQGDRLARSSCATDERCVPCFDPLSLESTGACNLGSDPGPTQAPRMFDQCCGGLGRCLPGATVPSELQSSVARDSCAEARDLCVPAEALGAEFVPAKCEIADLNMEGRCLPSCLPQVAASIDLLQSAGCPTGNSCVPCFDPRDGKPTGACNQGLDPGPSRPARELSSCCGGVGRCVPGSYVPAEVVGLLGADDCGSGNLCAPEDALYAGYVPQACVMGALGAEGRCVPRCLPAVQKFAGQLEADGCPAEHLCAPCFDPRTGESTGACALTGDPGPSRPAMVLDKCCGELGRCIPQPWIPESAQSLLGRDDCQASGQLCVAPAQIMDDPQGFLLDACNDPRTGAEGRCVPACLPLLAERAADLTQGSCPAAHLCTPCFDPITRNATGACQQGGDQGPKQPVVVFDRCCQSDSGPLGLCVPNELVPGGVTGLTADTCSGEAVSCVPAQLAEPSGKLKKCDSWLNAPGACLPICMLGTVRAALLPQAVCSEEERCAPCSELGSACSL